MKDAQVRKGYIIHDWEGHERLVTRDRDKAERAYEQGRTVEVGELWFDWEGSYRGKRDYPRGWRTFRKKEAA